MGNVVIIGAGQAGAEAALALRQMGHEGPVTILGAEVLPPYSRPPLSKDFLTGTLPPERLLLRSAQAYEKAGITLRLGVTVAGIDTESRLIRTENDEEWAYDACIIATGSSPRRLPVPGCGLGNVLTMRNRADADRLRDLIAPGVRLVVAGAGYLGLEVAASARKLGAEVTVVEAAPRLLGRSTSAPTAEALAARHRREGVRLLLSRGIIALNGNDTVREVVLADGERLAADVVVVSIGASPDCALASGAGIACANGILVDRDCRTNAADVYAIGDCANWDQGDGKGHMRLESVQMASQGARTAAAAITVGPRPGIKLPYFWSTQFDMKLQIAGIVPAGVETRDELTGDAGSAFAVTRYVNDIPVAVEAVNMPQKYIEAQRLIGTRQAQPA